MQRNFSMVLTKHQMIEPVILWLYPQNNEIFKVKNNYSRQFTVKGCQFLKYCDIVEF